MDVERFRRLPLLGILRGIAARDVQALADVVVASGLQAVEVTMNTANAPALIQEMTAASKGRIMVGAGTILGIEDLTKALDAGATFAVMPTLIPNVVERCLSDGIPVFPGGLTPLEIFNAWKTGATMVKVFPAGVFGANYLRDIKGPFRDVELLACGGVNAANMADYFTAGAAAVAFGASVFRPEWLAERRYEAIGAEIGKLVAACRSAVEAS